MHVRDVERAVEIFDTPPVEYSSHSSLKVTRKTDVLIFRDDEVDQVELWNYCAIVRRSQADGLY